MMQLVYSDFRTVKPLARASEGHATWRGLATTGERRVQTCASSSIAFADAPAIVAQPVQRISPHRPAPPGTYPGGFQNHYTLGSFLGLGTTGRVFSAKCSASGAEVAVKFIPKQYFGGRQQKSALHRETTIWRKAAAAAPQVTQLLSVHEDMESYYLVQEMCRGGSLHSIITAHGGLSEAQAKPVALCLAKFLAALHTSQIYYGDMKPGNVILKDSYDPCGEDGPNGGCINVKVVDFGCSQMLYNGARLRGVQGTPLFYSPELLANNYSLPADMWALGCTLYAMLSNRLPFWPQPLEEVEQWAPEAVEAAIASAPINFDGAAWAGVSDEVKDLLQGLLRRDERQRLTARDVMSHPWLRDVALLEGCPL